MLWIPGPTEVRPELLAECARPMIGHRSPKMVETIERLDPGLRLAFGLAPDSTASVAVHSASATAMMEAGLRGVGEHVICMVNGAFSKRWSQIAGSLGKQVTVIESAWGQPADCTALARQLQAGPVDAVTFVSSETSTGTLTPLADMARVLAKHDHVALLADLVSYIAGGPVDFDTQRLDFAFAGVQKAFALPPGVAVCCASERFMESARAQPNRGYYLDPVVFIEGHVARKTPATPCIPLYYALARQLEDIGAGVTLPAGHGAAPGAEAWRARFDKHARMQQRTVEWARGHGLSLLPEPGFGSPTVSCIQAGELDVSALVQGLKGRGFEISNGYGALKGKTFRIGHMGDHTEDGLNELLTAADEVLAGLPT
ncbi:MAG: aspartate aminotransferase-like enzyme [Chlamydiales bacterium]|jgi:aspartate aminotransferase-like enzyme